MTTLTNGIILRVSYTLTRRGGDKDMTIEQKINTALVMVDVQNDFCPGGKLPVTEGNLVVNPLNMAFQAARKVGLPIIATRDWHPLDAPHFEGFGGVWPEHCVKDSDGAAFRSDLMIDNNTIIVSKGIDGQDAYSGFEGEITSSPLEIDLTQPLDSVLKARGVNRLLVGGLATDYCVKATALKAVELGYETYVITEAMRAVDINPGDGQKAIQEMIDQGVRVISIERALAMLAHR